MFQRHWFGNRLVDERIHSQILVVTAHVALFAWVMVSQPAFGQRSAALSQVHPSSCCSIVLNADYPAVPTTNASRSCDSSDGPGTPDHAQTQGRMHRGVKRVLQDQKALYRAPFERSNLKWDVLVACRSEFVSMG